MLNFQMDLEHELWSLGVPVFTRHGEVAPHQYESAPIYETVSVATERPELVLQVHLEVEHPLWRTR